MRAPRSRGRDQWHVFLVQYFVSGRLPRQLIHRGILFRWPCYLRWKSDIQRQIRFAIASIRMFVWWLTCGFFSINKPSFYSHPVAQETIILLLRRRSYLRAPSPRIGYRRADICAVYTVYPYPSVSRFGSLCCIICTGVQGAFGSMGNLGSTEYPLECDKHFLRVPPCAVWS